MVDADIIPIDPRARSIGRAVVKVRCRASTSSGRPCRNYAVAGDDFCRIHGGVEATADEHRSPGGYDRFSSPEPEWGRFISRRLSGDYPIDDFGFDEHLFRGVLLPLMQPFYERWFRVSAVGLEHVPSAGPVLLVANHSGTIPLDALMMQYAVATEHPARRVVRNIGANLVWALPFLGALARKSGTAVACDEDATELLRRGECVGVFPEGFKGVGKGWRERYRLQRFGRGGFIEIALRTHTPIVPVAIVGAEEAYPMIGDIKPLARALGLPYFPVTPTWPLLGPLGAVPVPSKWTIEFGAPLAMDDYPEDAAEDAMLVFDLTDAVRDTIQQMLFRNLSSRRGAFF
jgi:1-acyl-sn-glycerol-3-phosphate acyltransferase